MCIVCPGLSTNPGVSCFTSSLASLALLSSLAASPPPLAEVTEAAALPSLAELPSFAVVAPSSLALFPSFPSNQGCAARREACVTKRQASSSTINVRLRTQSSRFTAPPVIPTCRDGRAVWDGKVESTTRANDYKHEGVLQSLRLVKFSCR